MQDSVQHDEVHRESCDLSADSGVRKNLEAPSQNNLSSVKDSECARLRKKLKLISEDAHLYQTKFEEEKQRGDDMQEEFRQRITGVRVFWRDKIYREGTWAGKILKKAMQS